MTTTLVIGGNRGIGLELARLSLARGERTLVTCRTASAELRALDAEVIEGIDVTADDAPKLTASALGGRTIDRLVLVAGVLESNSLGSLDLESIRRQFEVNALAPLRFVDALVSNLAKGSKVGVLTSRMGSIADNTSGGHYGYRMSKAALNAAFRSVALDLAPRGVSVAILHPGFVRTGMTGRSGLIDADASAALLLARMDALTLETSGTFFHADGSVLPW